MGQVPGLVSESPEPLDAEPIPDPSYSREESPESPTPGPEGEATPEESVEGEDKSGESPEEPPTGEPDQQPFSYRGKAFQSLEELTGHFDQVLSSREGHVRKEQERAAELQGQLEKYWQYIQDVESSLAPPANTPQPEASADGENGKPKGPVDVEHINKLMDLARKQGWDPASVGIQAVAEQLTQYFDKSLAEAKRELSAPIQQLEQYSEDVVNQQNLFKWAQSARDEDGVNSYPELQSREDGSIDENKIAMIHAAWREVANADPDFALSAMGFDYAYRIGLDLISEAEESNRATGQPGGTNRAPSPTPEGQVKPRDGSGRFISNADAEASSGLNGTVQSPVKQSPRLSETETILAKMGSVKTIKRGQTDLGFVE